MHDEGVEELLHEELLHEELEQLLLLKGQKPPDAAASRRSAAHRDRPHLR